VVIDDDVRGVLERTVANSKCYDGGVLRIAEQLDRALYLKVNKVLELLGGKWNRKTKAHVFTENARRLLADALQAGQVLDKKKAFQLFETPKDLAYQMVDLADLRLGMRVLEPSAGRGRIAEAMAHVLENRARVDVCEIQADLRAELCSRGFTIVGRDFLELTRPIYDRIVANPPFTKGQDIAHVKHMWDLLKPGGRLVSLTAPSWTFRREKKYLAFQDFFMVFGGRRVDIPEGTFRESGTDIKTVLIVLDKPETE